MNEKQGNWRTPNKRVSYETTGTYGIASDAPWVLVLAWASYVAMIGCNVAFETLKLGGTTTAEVSNQVFVWFTPAGYAFAIWTVIYIGLAIWLIALTREEIHYGRSTRMQGVLFIASSALNIAWLALFHYQLIALSLVAIILYWGVVALLYSIVHSPNGNVALRAPISIYLGWLSVAVIINATNLITRSMGSIAILNEISAIALSVIALGFAIAMAKLGKDYVLPAVVVWAVVAVGVHLAKVSPYVSAGVLAIAIIGALIAYLPIERLSYSRKGATDYKSVG